MTFRGRLLLASLLTLAVGVGALLVLGNVLLRHQVDRHTGALLRERVAAQLAAVTVRHGRIRVADPPNDDILDRQAWIMQGSSVVEGPPDASPAIERVALALGRRGHVARSHVDPDVELRAEPIRASGPGGPVIGSAVVALSVEQLEQLEELVLVGSIAAGALILLAGTLTIRGALAGALRPVAAMTDQADAWSAHDLDQRFGLGPPRDELTALAATLDGLMARIAASRRHEQRFAAEVAHELRTPLAGILGRAELALEDDVPEADRRDALEAVKAQTARLTGTIDTLLAVARREIDASEGTIDVVALAREVEGVDVVAPEPVPRAEGDADVVRRALAPLVENARRHARSAVTLELGATETAVSVAVRDDGPGVPTELEDHVFEPGFRGDDSGAGLGLPLARRLARSCGGDVTLGPGPGGCFVLRLPVVRG